MELSAIALTGLNDAIAKLDQSTRAVAAATAAEPEAMPVDTVDLATAMIGLLGARGGFDANIQVLRTADEMERRTLDILA